MDDMCTACLCTGRNLYFIGETGLYHLYSQILNEIPVYDFSDVCMRVCWECRALLRRFGDFKALVKRSYTKLLLQLHHNTPPDKQSLICSPRLAIQHVTHISYPIPQLKKEDVLDDHNYISERTDGHHILEEEPSVIEVKVENECDKDVSEICVDKERETRKPKKISKEKIRKVKKKKKKSLQNVNQTEGKTQKDTSESLNDDLSTGAVTVTTNNSEVLTVIVCSDGGEGTETVFTLINSDTDIVGCDVTEKDVAENPLRESNSISHREIHAAIDTPCPDDDAVENTNSIEDHEYALKCTNEKQIREEPLIDENEVKIDEAKTARKSKKVKAKRKALPQKANKNKKGKINKMQADSIESMDKEGVSDCENNDIFDEKDIEENEQECDVINSDSVNTDSDVTKKGAAVKDPFTYISVDGKTKCHECGKMFTTKKTFRHHLNTIHKGQNNFPCPRCTKVYQWRSNLARHMRTHQALDRGELHCEPCDKWFASIATYRQHLRLSRAHVDDDQYTFSCTECGKRFLDKRRLRDHVDFEHLQTFRFRCTLCNKAYKSRPSLYIHMQHIHSERKRDNLCHICGKSFLNTAKLNGHITAMHTGATPYTCGTCGTSFGWYSSLYRHTREVHCKIKLYKKSRKQKRGEVLPPSQETLPQQPGPAQ